MPLILTTFFPAHLFYRKCIPLWAETPLGDGPHSLPRMQRLNLCICSGRWNYYHGCKNAAGFQGAQCSCDNRGRREWKVCDLESQASPVRGKVAQWLQLPFAPRQSPGPLFSVIPASSRKTQIPMWAGEGTEPGDGRHYDGEGSSILVETSRSMIVQESCVRTRVADNVALPLQDVPLHEEGWWAVGSRNAVGRGGCWYSLSSQLFQITIAVAFICSLEVIL